MVGGSCERKKTTKHSLDVENEEKSKKSRIKKFIPIELGKS